MAVLLVCYLAVFAARLTLRWLNLRHLRRHGHRVPPGFEGHVDPDLLARTRDYTLANARAGLAESVAGSAALLVFLVGGWLEAYDAWVHTLADGPVVAGVLFFLGIHYCQTFLDVPFSLWRTFRVEARFGFNRTGWGLWLTDLLKSELVATVLLTVLAGGILALFHADPQWWWVRGWAFFAAVTVGLLYLSPYVIEPLFFRFDPIQAPELERRIRALCAKAGLGVSRVLQVDASRRSGHSNAYFSGIGRVKRIVLFDTLLDSMGADEVLAVLAHEVGHWKLRHLSQRVALTLLSGLAALYLAQMLLSWPGLSGTVGASQLSVPARLLVLSVCGTLAAFPLTPLSSLFSRRHERQADRYAETLTGEPHHLASALVKLGRDNLANLHPHPLYAAFYLSHPPLSERVAALGGPAAAPDACGPGHPGHTHSEAPAPPR